MKQKTKNRSIRSRIKCMQTPYEYFPLLLLFILFNFLPFIWTLQFAFTSNSNGQLHLTFASFQQLAENAYYRIGLKNSFIFSFAAVGAVIVLGILLSWLFLCAGKAVAAISALLPAVFVPSACLVAVWNSFSSWEVPTAWETLGLTIPRLSLLMLFLWKNIGLFTLIFMVGISQQPQECYEAASLDGAGRWSLLWRITLPLLIPVIGAASIYAFALSLRVYREAYLLFGAYPDNSVYMVMHFMNNHFQKLNYATLASGSILFTGLLVLPFAIGGGLYKIWRRQG